MRSAPIPWIGLVALIAMFAIPFLPDWLFEGPLVVRHRPRRHICGDCGASWTDGHTCVPEAGLPDGPALRGELRRPERLNEVARRIGHRRAGHDGRGDAQLPP